MRIPPLHPRNPGNRGWRITNASRPVEGLTAQMKFRVTPELRVELKAAAAARKIGDGELIRLYLTWGLEADRSQNRA